MLQFLLRTTNEKREELGWSEATQITVLNTVLLTRIKGCRHFQKQEFVRYCHEFPIVSTFSMMSNWLYVSDAHSGIHNRWTWR
jgi:hypothetical protein